MSGGVIGIRGDGAAEFLVGFGKIPIVIKVRIGQSGVSLRQGIIQFESFERCRFSLGTSLEGRQPKIRAVSNGIAICQAGVCQRVSGIFFNGLLKISESLLHSIIGSLVPEVAAAQIELVGFGIFRVALGYSLLFRAADLHLQMAENRLRNLILDAQNVGKFLSVLLAPELRILVYVD